MKRSLLVLFPLLGLLGCSSLPMSSAQRDSQVDQARVDAISRAAALRGVHVVWVTMPRKANLAPGS